MTTGPRSLDPRTPVIVGVGQLDVDEAAADPADEPLDLIERSVMAAATDTGATGVLAAVDAVRIVSILSWRYRDPGAIVATRIGANTARTAVSPMGGNSPQMLVNQSALDIASGQCDVVVIAGAEAWRTRQNARRAGVDPTWGPLDESAVPAEVIGSEMEMSHPAEMARGIVKTINAYPIFETAIRADAGRSPHDHLVHISELWARFSAVASANPHAAVRHALSAEEIRTPAPGNRWIGYPYTKWLVSNDRVDQSAALIMCSAERAEALGIARDRWVFPLAGTDTAEPVMSFRHDLHRSPAIGVGGGRVLELAGLGVDDLGHIDLYSCFPSAVQIGARELGIGLGRDLTVTGGLTFAGGPWNNYVTHSIATMVDVLRDDHGSIGLCTANGGLISKHSFGLYSTEPPVAGFRHDSPQGQVDAAPRREVLGGYDGPVTVEAYTVMHDRSSSPEAAMVACLTPAGQRTWTKSTDPDLMELLVTEEGCGRPGTVTADGIVHLD
jgi:acetyl-CoA C-acetyltransferase